LKLVKAGKSIRYWKMRKSSLKNNITSLHLQNLATNLGVEEEGTLCIADVDKRLTKARKDLKLVQKNAAATRDTHLEELARSRTEGKSGDIAMAIKNIKHCEELKQAFQTMKPITKGITGGVVSKILIPNPEGLSSSAIYPEVIQHLELENTAPYITIDDQD
jgi:hypothetical protein